ncbi:MAG: hypothetical protein HOO91_19095 [Bacteroidales bacterium]|nr:hypothetical protein [Bacteroidales bacterium]
MKEFKEFICSKSGLITYLIIVTLFLLTTIFYSWPNDTYFTQGKKSVDSLFVITDTVAKIHIEGKFKPEISSVLKDTSKLSLKITKPNKSVNETSITFLPSENPIPGSSLLLLIILIGALGSSLHGIVSISYHIGNGKFSTTWSTWYLLRPFAGGVLSLVFYLVIRAGFYKEFHNANFYTILALSGLVGMFSKQALNKLSELFDFIFKSDKEKEINLNPTPYIINISAQSISKSKDFSELIFNGSDFIVDSQVRFNNKDYKPEFVSSKQLKLIIKKDDLMNINLPTLRIAVFNPPPEGGLSNQIDVTLTP